MPQEFHVLRCYSCDTFQGHQVKSSKWQCKLCGSKQSVKMVFALGTGADCRKYVQNMNLLNGQKREQELAAGNELRHIESLVPTSSHIESFKLKNSESRWTVFLNAAQSRDSAFGQGDHREMSSTHPGSIKKSGKRKLNDPSYANVSTINCKPSKLATSLSQEDHLVLMEIGNRNPNSPSSDGEKTSATLCELSTAFMHKSDNLNARVEAVQNDKHKIASSSKWYKYIEN